MPEEKPNPFLSQSEPAKVAEKPNPFMEEGEKKKASSDSVTPLKNLNNFYPPTDSEAPSTKSKQQSVVEEHTKQQFLNNPLFHESNPNAEKNKKVWIDTLAKKGYNRSDLELVNKATTKAKSTLPEKGFWDKTEGEISRDFWNKTTDAALEGYKQVKQAFSEPLKTEEGKSVDANTPITKIDIAKPVTKAIVGGTTALFSPIIGAFGEVTDAIKSAADKTLPEPAAKVVGEALPTVFSLAHKAANALGYNPKEDSAGEHLLSIADMLVGGKVLHTPIKGYETIKSIGDLKEISQKAAKGELTPEEMKSYEGVIKDIKKTSLSDIKKVAEESNTPHGDVVASKISEIEKPSAEHKLSPELEDLHKSHQDLINSEVSPELQPFKDKAIADSQAKIDEHLKVDAESSIEEARKASELNHIDENIKLIEENKAKNADNPTFVKLLDEQLKPLQDRKIELSAKPEAPKEGELKPKEDATKERKLEESSVEQHQKGDEGRKTEETGGSNRNVESGKGKEEVLKEKAGEKPAASETPKSEKVKPESLTPKESRKLHNPEELYAGDKAVAGRKKFQDFHDKNPYTSLKENLDFYKEKQKGLIPEPSEQVKKLNEQFGEVGTHDALQHFEAKGKKNPTVSEIKSYLEDKAKNLHEQNIENIKNAHVEALDKLPEDRTDYEKQLVDKFGEKQSETAKEMGGIKHEETAKIRAKSNMEPYEKVPDISLEEADIQAKKWVKEGGNVQDVINKADKGLPLTLTENAVFGDYFSSVQGRIEKAPTPELIAERNKLIDIAEKRGTNWGREGIGRQRMLPYEDNLSNFLLDAQKAEGRELTPDEIKSETNAYQQLKAEKEKLEKALEAEQAAHAKTIAEQGYNQAKAKAKKASKKTHDQYVVERTESINKMKEALKRLRTGQEGVTATIPLANELRAIAPYVKEIAQSLANEGIDKIDVAVSQIHADLKDVVDGITKKNIIDILAGEHDVKKQTLKQKANELRLLKREAQLINKLAEVRKGEEKTPKAKSEKNARIEELEQKIKEVRRLNKFKERELDEAPIDKGLNKPKLKTDEERIKQKEANIKKRINQLETDIKDKNYEKEVEKPKPLKLSRETQDLQDHVIALQKTIKIKRLKAQESRLEKNKLVKVGKEILGIRRLAQTAFDWSVLGRQLAKVTLNPRHFDVTRKAFLNQFRSTFSTTKFDRLMDGIHKGELYHEAKEDGIIYNDLNTSDSKYVNEDYPKSFLYSIPILKDLFLASNRAADAALNTARAELYAKKTEMLLKQGITRESDPKAYKDMANWVMNITGRGKMADMLENSKASMVLGQTFFGARLMAAHFNTLNPKTYLDPKIDKAVKMDAVKDIVGFTSAVMTTALALKALGADVDLDPDQSDFLQVRFGDKVYDITGGSVIYTRTGLRLMEAAYYRGLSTLDSEDEELKEQADKSSEFASGSTVRFFRNKLAPNPSYITNWYYGKNTIGQPFDPKEILEVYPMYVDDFYKAMQEDGVSSVATVLAPNILGFGYASYANKNAE